MRIELDNPWLYALLISVLAIIIWLIFQPGFMNGDAMVIYAQASNESYHDWHPPVMAFVLRGFFNIGLGLSELMLVQCLLAYLGLYGFSYQLLNILKVSKSALKGFLIVIFLSTPVFPFPFYTMAFLKDLWCAMAFLWLMLLAFYLHHQPSFKYNTFKFWSILGLMIFFMVLAILARHNALVLFPVFIGIIYNICKKARMQVGLSIACM